MTDDATGNDSRKTPLSFGWVWASLVLMAVAFAIPETFRWNDPWTGFSNGLMAGATFALGGAVLLFPVLLVVKLASRWWKPGKFTRALLIALPLVLLGARLLYPVNPAEPFKNATSSALPANAKGLRSVTSGGGIADRGDEFYFETTPEEVDRLILELRLRRDESPDWPERVRRKMRLPDEPTLWTDAVKYYGDRKSTFYTLITDGTRTRVWIQSLGI